MHHGLRPNVEPGATLQLSDILFQDLVELGRY